MDRPRHLIDINANAMVSRRAILRRTTLGVGGLAIGLTATNAFADAPKVKQKTVSYQPTPKGRARCDNCSKWQPPHACSAVEGEISPSGWCSIYAPKV